MFKKFTALENTLFVLFWITYAILCLYFYIERSTYADNSYYLFNIIQKKSLNLEHYRFTGLFSQWLAVIAVKLHLNLKLVLFCFSLNPIVYQLYLFLLVYFISNNKLFVYTYILILIGCIYYSFFYTADELFENMSVFAVLVSVIHSNKLKIKIKYILIFFCQLILLFTHPLLVVVAGALMFVLYVSDRSSIAFFSFLSICIMVGLKFFFLSTGRDSSIINNINYKAITLRHIHSSGFALYIKSIILERHLALIVLWCFLFYKGKATIKIKVLVLLVIFSIYILIMLFLLKNINYIYIDRYFYLLLTFSFSIILLVLKFEPISEKLKYSIWLIILFSFFKLFTMNYLNNRELLLNKLLKEPEVKQIYFYVQMPDYIQQMSWSVPYETLFLSTLNGKTKTVLIKEPFFEIDQYLSDSSIFLGAEWSFGIPNILDKDYFPLEHSIYQFKKANFKDSVNILTL